MRALGWVRLWLLSTVVAVPAAAVRQFDVDRDAQAQAVRPVVQGCLAKEMSSPKHPDALECMHAHGVDGTVFERMHTTPLEYWSGSLSVLLAVDLLVTVSAVELVLVIRLLSNSLRRPGVSPGAVARWRKAGARFAPRPHF